MQDEYQDSTDVELLLLAQAGSDGAFTALHDRYQHQVITLTIATFPEFLGDIEAQQAYDDAVLELRKKYDPEQPGCTIKTYLFLVTKYRAQDQVRQLRRFLKKHDFNSDVLPHATAPVDSHQKELEDREHIAYVFKHMSNPRHIACLQLCYDGHNSVDDIALHFKITPNNAGVLWFRAKNEFRQTEQYLETTRKGISK